MATQNALEQAYAHYFSIVDLLSKFESDDEDVIDAAYEELCELPLEISVRGSWRGVGRPHEDDEYAILLCTGGPAVRVTGALSDNTPSTAQLQCQDWFTEWEAVTDVDMNVDIDENKLLQFAQIFHFGEWHE